MTTRITTPIGTPTISPGTTKSSGEGPCADGMARPLDGPVAPSGGGGVANAAVRRSPEATVVGSADDGTTNPDEAPGPGVGRTVAVGTDVCVGPGRIEIGRDGVGSGPVGTGSVGVGTGSVGMGSVGMGSDGKVGTMSTPATG